MGDVTNRPVLVLNRHWLAVHVCTVRRAIAMLVQDIAHVVCEDYQTYDFTGWVSLSKDSELPALPASNGRNGNSSNGNGREMNGIARHNGGNRSSNGNGSNGINTNGGKNGHGQYIVRTPYFAFLAPRVIVLQHYQKNPPRSVRFNRRNVYLRDDFRCQYCSVAPGHERLTLDHVIPRSRGGLSVWENVVAACERCNARKGAHLPGETGMKLSRKPRRPSWMAAVRLHTSDEDRLLWTRFVDPKQLCLSPAD